MAFSRQRELIKTQETIWKLQVRRLKQRHKNQSIPIIQPQIVHDYVSSSGALHDTLEYDESDDDDVAVGNNVAEPFDAPPLAKELRESSIFVSVPSYRDPECPKTVADIFEKATFPGRIIVGVCQQNESDDLDCMESEMAKRFSANIRVMRIHASEAKGPVYARALIEQSLFKDEDYYMNVDSHTLFIPGWDVEVIRQLIMCPSDKPVLTCYPPDYDITNRQMPVEQPATFLKFRDFHPKLGFSQQDPVRFRHTPPHPLPSLFWAGGFSFTLGEVVRQVPFDINLQYVFLGEEITMAARLYTNGFDTFAPMRNVVYHYTPRKTATGAPRPTFWEQFYKKDGKCKVASEVREERKILELEGNKRMRLLLEGQLDDSQYGLGTARTLQQFADFVGLNFTDRTHRRHSALGLTLDPSETEKYCKYGMETFI